VAGAGLNLAPQLGHGLLADPRHYGHLMDEADEAAMLAAVDAIMQTRAASGASALDRIVGLMSASGSYDTMPSNGSRGATMGPPACPLQSPPVPFRRRRRGGLQGLSANRGDWRGHQVFLIRKRSQVRVLDRPSLESRNSLHLNNALGFWLLEDRRDLGAPRGHMGPPAVTCGAKKRSWFRAAVRSAGALRTPSAAY
jgi:hypothetical protein